MKKIFLCSVVFMFLIAVGCDIFAPEKDSSPPAVTITSPMADSTQTGDITLSAAASDDVSVYQVSFFCDDILIGTVYQAPYSLDWNSSTQVQGYHKIKASASDSSGNYRSSAPVTIIVGSSTVDSFTEDFDDYEEGNTDFLNQNMSDYWLGTGSTNDSQLAIVPAPGRTGMALHSLDDDAAASFNRGQLTLPDYAKGNFSFDFRFGDMSKFLFILGEVISTIDGELESKEAIKLVFDENPTTGKMRARMHNEFTDTWWNLRDFELDQWYNIEMNIDADHGTSGSLLVSIDGQLLMPIIMYNDLDKINTLFIKSGEYAGDSSDIYIDNISFERYILETPGAPSGITASDMEWPEQILLDWNSVAYADYYNVYSSTSQSGNFTLLGTTPHTSTWIDGFSDSQYRYYRVTAENDSGESTYDGTAIGRAHLPVVLTSDVSHNSTLNDLTSVDWYKITPSGNKNLRFSDGNPVQGLGSGYTADIIIDLYDSEMEKLLNIPTSVSNDITGKVWYYTSELLGVVAGETYYISVTPAIAGSYRISIIQPEL